MKSQQDKILHILKIMRSTGVNSYDLTYVYGIKQAPTRVKELRLQGYNIISKPLPNRSVQYILSPTEKTLPIVSPPWEEELIPVIKNGRIFWEKPDHVKTKQLSFLGCE